MERLPHLQLVIAGDGPERGELEQLSASLQLANVKFIGHLGQEELDLAIAASRFTVLPSHAYETLGKTILESYAHGRAVVASDLGSRRELIHDGKSGLLYKTGDVPELVAALGFLGSQPELADEMGRAGRELVRQHYTPEAHYDFLISLYERLAIRKRTSQGLHRFSHEEPSEVTQTSFAKTTKTGFVPLEAPHINADLARSRFVFANHVPKTGAPRRIYWRPRGDLEI